MEMHPEMGFSSASSAERQRVWVLWEELWRFRRV